MAPGATTIAFSPSPSTITSASPVRAVVVRTSDRMPSVARTPSSSRPSASAPTAPTKRVRAPARAAATAWLSPLPPGPSARPDDSNVCPATGSAATSRTRSRLALPSTVTPLPPGMAERYWRTGRTGRSNGNDDLVPRG